VSLALLGTVAFFAVTGRLSVAGIRTFLRSGEDGGDDGGEGGSGETQSLLSRDGVAAAAAAAAAASTSGADADADAGVAAAESVALANAPATGVEEKGSDEPVVRKGRYQPPPVRFGKGEAASGV
jgi:hypothetical protein